MARVRYHLAWDSGPTSQVDLFNATVPPVEDYKLKYKPPFRSTVSSPIYARHFDKAHRAPIDSLMARIAELLGEDEILRGGSEHVAAAQSANLQDTVLTDAILTEVKRLGRMLCNQLLPPEVRLDLRPQIDLFLELGIDEMLLNYPWELMHDGQDYLALKHFIGRFVNTTLLTLPQQLFGWWGAKFEPLSALLIAVSDTEKDDFPSLPQAEAEAKAFTEILTDQKLGIRVQPLVNREATFQNVFDIITGDDNYQIMHFCGHAVSDPNDPRASRLILYDEAMPIGYIVDNISTVRPIFCFINACESGQITLVDKSPGQSSGSQRFNLHGLGRAFLETGAYLLGTRKKIGDNAAYTFAAEFYRSLLDDRQPLGEAIRRARRKCREGVPATDLGWASYVFYGDPRVKFERETVE
jgi:CHAT domain-containing protein